MLMDAAALVIIWCAALLMVGVVAGVAWSLMRFGWSLVQ